ncbi:MAG: LPS export ABC transporter permease LptG [Alphaproteobacteria bacterium]|nr:LPS export ABC transporter permease LptG [Alphaproteobacteria bacterium]
MRIPLTLSLYIGRAFLTATLTTLLVMMVIVGLMELLELVRRGSETPNGVPFGIILEMTFMKLPNTVERIYPFAFLIGGMTTLSRLTRTNELAVVRSAGVSVWQFLFPGLVIAFVLGMIFITVVNPIASAMVSRFERIEGRYISNKPSMLTISLSGLWLRQVDENGVMFNEKPVSEYILHARRMDQATLTLVDIIIFFYDDKSNFLGRIDAKKGQLTKGAWQISDAMISAPGLDSRVIPNFAMNTTLTLSQIQESFAPPETFSFWQLPEFINVLEKAGFSAIRHKLYWHTMMALPFLLAGMVMVAAVFSLRQARRGKTGILIVLGIVTGFVFYFSAQLIYALGASGALPLVLSAWAPSLVVLMLGGSLLLHLEDG